MPSLDSPRPGTDVPTGKRRVFTMTWRAPSLLLALAVLSLPLGCDGNHPAGDVIVSDPTSNLASVSLVAVPDPGVTTCSSGRTCGCAVIWTWQTGTDADSGTSMQQEEMDLGSLPIGTLVEVEGTVRCFNNPSPLDPTGWGGSVEIRVDEDLVAVDLCHPFPVPQTGTATCTVSASHTVGG
jgi:hypothetical protein